MSKEAERRYSSAGEFADDLERFLTGHPVVAREPSLGYHAAPPRQPKQGGRRRCRRRHGRHPCRARRRAVAAACRGSSAGAEPSGSSPKPGSSPTRSSSRFTTRSRRWPARRRSARPSSARRSRISSGWRRSRRGDPSLQLELSRAYRQIGFIQGNPSTVRISATGPKPSSSSRKPGGLALPLARQEQRRSAGRDFRTW